MENLRNEPTAPDAAPRRCNKLQQDATKEKRAAAQVTGGPEVHGFAPRRLLQRSRARLPGRPCASC
jgi:hypothetical protein